MAEIVGKGFDNARVNEKEFGSRESGVRHSINDSFYNEFDAWDGKNPSVTFTIGNTSEALQSVGVKNQSVVMRSGMIINKLNKHAEMSRGLFKQIPELLENPIIVQFSDAIDPNTGKQKYDSRITVLGELQAVIDGNKVPVLISIELLPTNQKKTSLLDISVITSAYGHSKLNQYLKENSILYIDPDKKRTNNWLTLNRLQLPVGENKRGSIRKITYSGGKVKIQNPIHMTQMHEKLYKAGVVDEYGEYIDPNARHSKDDTIYDWLTDEFGTDEDGVQISDIVHRNTQAAA